MPECRVPPYVAEMPVAGFKTAALFLLTTLRLWLAAHRRASAVDWRQDLAAAGLLEDGAPDFDMALRLLSAAARPALSSRDAGHLRLGAHEARLLQLFGALQRGKISDAVAELQVWLPSRPLRWLLRYAGSFARTMASQRLILPDRSAESDRNLRYAPAPAPSSIVVPFYCIRLIRAPALFPHAYTRVKARALSSGSIGLHCVD